MYSNVCHHEVEMAGIRMIRIFAYQQLQHLISALTNKDPCHSASLPFDFIVADVILDYVSKIVYTLQHHSYL